MKTTMQELRDNLISTNLINAESDTEFMKGYISAIGNVIKEIEDKMIKRERAQIIKAYDAGMDMGANTFAEDYYHEIYGSK